MAAQLLRGVSLQAAAVGRRQRSRPAPLSQNGRPPSQLCVARRRFGPFVQPARAARSGFIAQASLLESGSWSHWSVMAACSATAQVLEKRTMLGKYVSAPLLAMFFAISLSSASVIPSVSEVYDVIWTYFMPVAAAMYLLDSDLRELVSAAGATLLAFGIGAAATVLGTLAAWAAVGAQLGPDGYKVAAALCASYVGGSVNFAAVASALGMTPGRQLASAMAADNVAMAGYLAIISFIPAAAGAAADAAAAAPIPTALASLPRPAPASPGGSGGAPVALLASAAAAAAGPSRSPTAATLSEMVAAAPDGAAVARETAAAVAETDSLHEALPGPAGRRSADPEPRATPAATVEAEPPLAAVELPPGGHPAFMAGVLRRLSAASCELRGAEGTAGGGGRQLALLPALDIAAAARQQGAGGAEAARTAAAATSVSAESVALALAAAAAACTGGRAAASAANLPGADLAFMAVIATVLGSVGASVGGESKGSLFPGAEAVGGALMLMFFSSIGAGAGSLAALGAAGPLLGFISLQLAAHLAIVLAVGGLLKLPMQAILTASNANIGGPATAAAMAAARGWTAQVRPAMLTGSLGYAIGTAVGCAVAPLLR